MFLWDLVGWAPDLGVRAGHGPLSPQIREVTTTIPKEPGFLNIKKWTRNDERNFQPVYSTNFDHNVPNHVGGLIAAIGRIREMAVNLTLLEHFIDMLDVFTAAEEVS